MTRHTIRRTVAATILALAAGACTPAQMAAWDDAHDLPPGTTARALADVSAHQGASAAPSSPRAATVAAIDRHFGRFGPTVVRQARAVAECESNMGERPGNPSPTNDWGPFQVNAPTWNHPGHADPVADWIGRHWHRITEADVNVEAASRIFAVYGWGMWTCQP